MERSLEPRMPPEAGADRDANGQRAHREKHCSPRGVDDADEDGRHRPLEVAAEEEQRAPARRPRRETGAALRVGEVGERVERLRLFDRSDADRAEGGGGSALAEVVVDAPGEHPAGRELQRSDHLLRDEEHAGEDQHVPQCAPLR
jgi:hypothetical protein